MLDRRVARRYARALFNTALRFDVVSSVEGDLAGISNLLSNDPQFRDFVHSPYVGREEKLKIADRLFSDRVTALTMQALRLLLEKRRETEIEAVRLEFIELRRRHEQALSVQIVSAEMLTKEQQDAVVQKLNKITGKKVEPEFSIDPRLIGGVRAAFDNIVLDGSLRGSLDRLRDKLKYDLLKQN